MYRSLLAMMLLVACAPPLKVPQASFDLNGQRRNGWIKDRRPEYGDTRRDGCIVLDAIALSITHDRKNSVYVGRVIDAQDQEPIGSAVITFWMRPPTSAQQLVTDAEGRFTLKTAGICDSIHVQQLGWRSLRVAMKVHPAR
ncbi:MAG: carboxypeptidase regulatory-like domain-containing protein [Flavobacteriales bacterium]|nr:carboxypeptidase regulatory-like domain-containing protein [Flavobacteriales bacterium]